MSLVTDSKMDAGLYSVPNGLMHTSKPKLRSCLPMLSVKQLPSIMILSLYEMPTLHFSSATGVCSFMWAKLSKKSKLFPIFGEYLDYRSFASLRMTYDKRFTYIFDFAARMLC